MNTDECFRFKYEYIVMYKLNYLLYKFDVYYLIIDMLLIINN